MCHLLILSNVSLTKFCKLRIVVAFIALLVIEDEDESFLVNNVPKSESEVDLSLHEIGTKHSNSKLLSFTLLKSNWK